MKLGVSAFVLAAALAFGGGASAAVINYSAVIDLDSSMFGVDSFLAQLPGGPLDVAVGDTIEGTITFAHLGRVTMSNGVLPDQRERISASFSPGAGRTAFSTGSFELLGVQGDYLGPATIPSLPVGGALGVAGSRNLTDTSFSFSGISFSITYVDESTPEDFPLTSQVTPSFLAFNFTPSTFSEAAAAPEPATWATMTLGLGMLGGVLRRRRAVVA